jgi:hypothetical protein
VPTRTSKQCRERWFDRLAPELKRTPFEPWEDEIISEKQREVGNKWSVIANYLPGRSPGAVKNRWYSGLKSSNQMMETGMGLGIPGMGCNGGPVMLGHDHFDRDALLHPGDPRNDL